MKSKYRFITEFFRIIVGVTFMFSGFVKAVDPLGFAYKIQDYFVSFDLVSLFPLALPMAIVMVVAEVLVGLFILMGIYRKYTSIVLTLFMAFFLPLTLWIAIKNPVEDCGCFGDAWVISNWDTFFKNIVLSIGAVVLLYNHKQMKPLFSNRASLVAASFSVVFAFSFAIYNTVKLPMFDFRPYKIGNSIPEQMQQDPDNSDIVENIFIYSKDGLEKEFTEDNYPWDDSTWVYVDMESRVLKEGIAPKVKDFHINLYTYDEEFEEYIDEDITEDILTDPEYSFLMVAYSLERTSLKHINKFKNANKFAQENNIKFYVLTSSLIEDIMDWNNKNGLSFQYAETDERVLKTMIRSNPGLILLRDGVVINKWDDSDVPNFELSNIDEWSQTNNSSLNFWSKLVFIFLLFVVPLFAIKVINYKIERKSK